VTETIYVYLLDEGVDVWRPVEALVESVGYRITGSEPEGENWQFKPGSLVRCEWQELAKGRNLVASEEVG
jgi:hypothetical protein